MSFRVNVASMNIMKTDKTIDRSLQYPYVCDMPLGKLASWLFPASRGGVASILHSGLLSMVEVAGWYSDLESVLAIRMIQICRS